METTMIRYLSQILAAAISLLTIVMLNFGCSSSDNGTAPDYDVAANLGKGWASFSTSAYDSAVTTFTDVLSHSANNAEALLGRGWCYAFKNQYDSSMSDLNAASTGSTMNDAKMGLAAVYRDFPDLNAAITYASAVIAADSHYVFSKRTSIDYKDAHLIKAQCYFRLGKDSFPQAHVEINYLCAIEGIAGLPEPGTVSGAEYERQLGLKLEELSARIAE
jgi:tetratricopeptide (TPR) repeat protein